MPQLVKKRRSGWAVLAAGALVASLLAVGSAPAGAVEIKAGDDNRAEPSVTAAHTACVGDATGDAGFTDTAGLGAEDAINCLAYYGITTGKTATTFDPGSNVTRSQMALFLSRAAKAAGVDLSGGKMAADFGDIADQGDDRQGAIQALARNGILVGRSGTAFEPDEDITRAEMAVAMVNFVRKTRSGVFDPMGNLKAGDASTDPVLDVDHFADARASEPRAVDTAISYAYELGITTGYPDATFRPDDSVPRKNMASFITRALAHSNLRPAGVTAQHGANGVVVSVRGADFAPVANVAVDAFKAKKARAGDVFAASGACTRIPTKVGGNELCKIDSGDYSTDTAGNLTVASPAADEMMWVWSGASGATVGEKTDLFEVAGVVPPVTASELAVSVSLPKEAKTGTDGSYQARYGVTVTYTLQLKGDHDRNAATPNVDAGPPRGGAEYTVKVSYQSQVVTVTDYKVDSSGKAAFNVTYADPNPNGSGNTSWVTVGITRKGTSGPAAPAAADIPKLTFTDAAPGAVTTVTASADPNYMTVPNSGTAVHRVSAAVFDAFGQGVPGTRVAIDPDGSGTGSAVNATARYTTAGGKIDLNAARSASQGAGKQTLSVVQDTEPKKADSVTAGVSSADLVIYWVKEAAKGAAVSGPVVAGDPAKGEIVVMDSTTNAPTLVRFDSNDQYQSPGAYGMAAFVKYISADADLTGKGNFEALVSVASYDPDDSSVVVGLTASTPPPPTTTTTIPQDTVTADSLDVNVNLPEMSVSGLFDAGAVGTNTPNGNSADDCEQVDSNGDSVADNDCYLVQYGTTVTYTMQLKGDDPKSTATPKPKVDAGPGTAGMQYKVTVTKNPQNTNFADPESTTHDVARDGSLTFDVSISDPSTTAGNYTLVDVKVEPVAVGSALAVGEKWDEIRLRFSDTGSTAATLSASAAADYVPIADGATSTTETTNTVSAKVYDQYGYVKSGVRLGLDRNNNDTMDAGDIATAQRTDDKGEATLTVTHTGNTGASQSLSVLSDTEADTNTATWEKGLDSNVLTIYWVTKPPDADDDGIADDDISNAMVLGGDLSTNELVLAGNLLVTYAEGDTFNIPGDTNSGLAAFEAYVGNDEAFGGDTGVTDVDVTVTGYKLTSTATGTTTWTASDGS